MLHKAFNPQDSNTLHPRCQHHTAKGRQCRTQLTSSHPTLCTRHARLARERQRDDSADLSALLLADLPEKKSAADIHALLWNLSLALQQGRISPRRAAVLAYINSLLLRTLPAIEKQQSPGDHGLDITNVSSSQRVVVGMPRPIRNRPLPPSDAPPQLASYPTPNSSSSSAPRLYGFHPTHPSPCAQTSDSAPIGARQPIPVPAPDSAHIVPTPIPQVVPAAPARDRRQTQDPSAQQTQTAPRPVVRRAVLCYSVDLGQASNIARPSCRGVAQPG